MPSHDPRKRSFSYSEYLERQAFRDHLWGGVREFFVLVGLQSISYLNITVDMRAIAHQQYAIAAITSGVAPLIAWFMIKRVVETRYPVVGKFAVVVGGILSTLLGMWLTRGWQ